MSVVCLTFVEWRSALKKEGKKTLKTIKSSAYFFFFFYTQKKKNVNKNKHVSNKICHINKINAAKQGCKKHFLINPNISYYIILFL